jgi:myo-inositol catabolism protein IolH
MGEVDYDAVFAALAAVDFDGVLSSCVFGFEEDARGVSERQRDKAIALVNKHFGEQTGASLTSTTPSTQAGS